ncbi:divalent-cation tolerance protein CutA [Spartobacteria bacterium LR76]|uniref:Divalent cation tolerance protein n=1 Tax=Terrimicrobium sacchariphilum TaxID=690879 RepID=A0A146G3D7_TERSA|nr:divalent-cation tolerance protein CutA [Terrimicrobium sacchariphilum]PTY00626.1 divalent-cation tolerance protein CutA [Spartobacteria bacterium LR76]GAT32170.1 divalent cation tolerance protein [Terrimicrobium sacchariphilum]
MKLALTTFATQEEAAAVVRQLLEERVIACGTILPPARSLYVWHGKVEDSTESVVLLKTGASRLDDLRERLLALHPYDTPEFVVLDPETASPAYLAWVRQSCGE